MNVAELHDRWLGIVRIENPDPLVRALYIAYGVLKPTAANLTAALKDPEAIVRKAAVGYNPLTFKQVAAAIKDPDPEVVLFALKGQAHAALNGEEVDFLTEHPDRRVRFEAAKRYRPSLLAKVSEADALEIEREVAKVHADLATKLRELYAALDPTLILIYAKRE